MYKDCFARDGTVHIEKMLLQKQRLSFFINQRNEHKEDIKKYPPACGKKKKRGGKRGRRKNGG